MYPTNAEQPDPSYEALCRIGPICDSYEAKCLDQAQPEIGPFLEMGEAPDRELLLRELIKLDIEYRVANGEHPLLSDYLVRFPDDKLCLQDLWSETETFHSPTTSTIAIRSTVRDLPTRLGNYELLEILGKGGMGVVYRAIQYIDSKPIREVAIKLIRNDSWWNAAAALDGSEDILVSRFREETRFAAQLEHPNIIRVYEVGRIDGIDFFSMQLISGMDLAAYMQTRLPTYVEIARLLIPIAQAIAYAHERNIVHRDLKPSNILVDGEGNSYVADFGLATSIIQRSDLTQTGQILGTPGYMSPEQARGGFERIGTSADIYGFGAILYYCLTKRAPFAATDIVSTLVQVLENDPILPRKLFPEVPRSLELICMRCLSKAINSRYGLAIEIVDDLERFLQGIPTLAKAPTILDRLRQFGRRSPVIVTHLGGLGLAFLLGQMHYFLFRNTDLLDHATVTLVMLSWIGMSIVFGYLTGIQRLVNIVATIWLCADAVVLTAIISMLCNEEYPANAILIGFPMIVLGGGMFFRVRMVIVVTTASMLSYVFLLWLEPAMQKYTFQNLLFLVMLACIGLCNLHQVRRFQTLSNFIELRRSQSL